MEQKIEATGAAHEWIGHGGRDETSRNVEDTYW
jgi:hypothetical protein